MKKFILLLLVTLISWFSTPLEIYANGLPYRTYTYSSSLGHLVFTQDAYLPLSMSYDIAGYTLDDPQDITVDKDDNIYIADYGNGRVLKYNLQANHVSVIGEDFLVNPSGVHIGVDGHLYVADFGAKKAYQFIHDLDTDNYVLGTTYEKPVGTPYFSESDAFEPTKIITDTGRNVYLLLAGDVNGLAEFENNGEFFGYFGGNRIPNTWDNTVRFLLFNEEQRREWFQMIPKPLYNVAVDPQGLILTTTKKEPGYLKLNIANYVYSASIWGMTNVEDMFVGPYNTIFNITDDGYIVEYDANGSVLFIFSGPSVNHQKGLFTLPRGITVDSNNNLYAIDAGNNTLQVFAPTEFADLVHTAISLYQEGKYDESLEPWQDVLKMNRLFDLANQGIADAYFAQMDYPKAMDFYRLARDQQGYSNAFWEVRNDYLLDSGEFLIFFIIFAFLLSIINHYWNFMKYVKKPFIKAHQFLNQYKLYQELLFPFYIIKNPADGYYGIKREKKGSNLAATIYLLLFFFAYITFIYQTSFLFNTQIAAEINVFEQVISIFLPFGLWVLANYLVSSIRDGEGKLSDVYQASSFSLLPMIIMLPVATLISHGLTYNEAFIFDTIWWLGVGLTVLYFIIMVKEIHYYDLKPTFMNIFISIFTGLMILAMVLIVYLLLNEVFILISDIIREVGSRV